MRQLSPFSVSRLKARQTAPADHPSADLLTAFAETTLRGAERAAVLSHLAACSDCREILALASKPKDVEAPVVEKLLWWRPRWVALAVASCFVIALTTHSLLVRRIPSPRSVDVMIAKPPAPSPELPQTSNKQPAETKITRRKAPAVTPPPPPAPARVQVLHLTPPDVESVAPQADSLATETFAREQLPPPAPAMPAKEFRSLASMQRSRSPLMRSLVARKHTGKWRLDSASALQRSDDGGATWQTVAFDSAASFYGLSVVGDEVWVGGSGGALFHSADNGTHWKAVTVEVAGRHVTETITSVEAFDERSVRIQMQPGGTWVTTDGGEHWSKP